MNNENLKGIIPLQDKVWEEIYNSVAYQFGYIGTRVFLNDSGKVEVKVLSLDECLDLKAKIDSGEIISDEYIIQKIEED